MQVLFEIIEDFRPFKELTPYNRKMKVVVAIKKFLVTISYSEY
jgi:hypothetical protein